MEKINTPGVYINEIGSTISQIAGVKTAVPGFVGYTQKASVNGESLVNIATKISSMAEYEIFFGTSPEVSFALETTTDEVFDFSCGGDYYAIEIVAGNYNLYNSIELFFANGGGECYIVSVGNYTETWTSAALIGGIGLLEEKQEVTMLVVPETILAPTIADYATIITAMMQQAGKLKSRIAIVDVYKGDTPFVGNDNEALLNFWNVVGNDYLSYSVAYFPFLNTSIIAKDSISYVQITDTNIINNFLKPETGKTIQELENSMDEEATNKYLIANSPTYNVLLNALQAKINVLPPGSAMAGIYTTIDSSEGVWNAPANISLERVVSPVVSMNDMQQGTINMPINEISVNAIRWFGSRGTVAWGAKTMDSNSMDYKYISIRRTIIYIEQSIQNYCSTLVFEPNDNTTWAMAQATISNFLYVLWSNGALMGASPKDAFAVNVGLGATMTAQDILNGLMVVNVMVAMVHPAEFIAISITQKMQQT